MKYYSLTVLTVLIISFFCFTTAQYTVSPALDAQRRQVIETFIHKTEDSYLLAVGNLTAYAYYTNGTLQYQFCTDVTGCFQGNLAQDYMGVVFVQVPIPTANGVIYQQFSKIKINLYPTSIVLAQTNVVAWNGYLGDRYTYSYYINSTQLDFSTGGLDVGDGIVYTGNLVFATNTSKIMSEVVYSGLGTQFFDNAAGSVTSIQLCSGIVGVPGVLPAACPVNTTYQQYSSIDDCLTKMAQVVANQATSPCPDILTTNSTSCRNIHYATALANPPQSQLDHCPHVQIPSPVCIDRCLISCSNCHADASCIFEPTSTGARTYYCQCNPGYTGDGVNSCVAKTCSAQYQCSNGNDYNYVTCQNGFCGCSNTFNWNITDGSCYQPTETTVIYNSNGQAVALPNGRCYQQYQCSNAGLGDYNSLSCVQFGVNAFVPYYTCLCNYGYDGGFNVPCTCASGKSVEWSSQLNANVCLLPTECTENYECVSPQICNKTVSGYPGVVGTCA
jgi:hypothetical protein